MYIFKFILKINYYGLKGFFNNEYIYIEIVYILYKF